MKLCCNDKHLRCMQSPPPWGRGLKPTLPTRMVLP